MVDAGFLLKALVLKVGEDSRASAAFDYAAISEVLADVVEEQTGLRPVRQVWYDAARDARPGADHRALAELPGVQIRLGWTVLVNGGKPQQKAVDTLIVRDLLRIAYRGSADEIVLIAGDGDLVPGVQEASEFGVVVHLWGIASDDRRLRQSQELVALADTRLNLDVADLAAFVRVKTKQTPSVAGLHAEQPGEAPGLAPDATIAANAGAIQGGTPPVHMGIADAVGASGSEPAGDDGTVMGDLVILSVADRAAEAAEDAEEVVKSAVSLPPSASTGAPSLRQLLTPEEFKAHWLDDQLDEVDAREVGRRYGARWVERVGVDGHRRFVDTFQRPRLPKRIDLDLLQALKDRQFDVDDQPGREDARNGFWDSLDTRLGDALPAGEQ